MSANNAKIRHSFNKMSKSYSQNCALQNEVAQVLLNFCNEFLEDTLKIIDLGAGSGNIAKNLSNKKLDFLLAIDNAPNMLILHPQNLPNIAQIKLLCCDFEDYDFSDEYDLVLSSSALQWAKNLDFLFKKIKDTNNLSKSKKFAFAIFTNESLRELHEFLGTKSPLKSSNETIKIAQKYFCVESKIERFSLKFSTREELLAYLKNGGLLGGGNLSFTQKKQLRFNTPFLSANFEVLFLKGVIK